MAPGSNIQVRSKHRYSRSKVPDSRSQGRNKRRYTHSKARGSSNRAPQYHSSGHTNPRHIRLALHSNQRKMHT